MVAVPKSKWERVKKNKDGHDILTAEIIQYPLRLAYAITIHKSQGQSLDYVEVDLSGCFADGQAYVALSRARSFAGLRLRNFSPSKIKTNKYCYDFYMEMIKNGKN